MYKNYHSQRQLEAMLATSQRDKQELSRYIKQLNQCYQAKIAVLKNKVFVYQSRLEEMLLWKRDHMQKQIEKHKKLEQQNRKLVKIVEQLSNQLQREKISFKQQLEAQKQQIQKIKTQRDNLLMKQIKNQENIQRIIKELKQQPLKNNKLPDDESIIRQFQVKDQHPTIEQDYEQQNQDSYQYVTPTVIPLKQIANLKVHQRCQKPEISQK